jgi:two-component system cell cycle response regulator DivK
MPEIQGRAASSPWKAAKDRKIKALPGLAATAIAVSSFAMKGDEEKARASGCDDYVTKPYSPKQLLALVRHFLAKT